MEYSFDFAAVCLFSAVISILTSVIWFGKKNIAESAVIGISWFFCSYILCSMGLFVIDKFALFRAAAVSLILNAALLAVTVILRKKKPFSVRSLFNCDFSIKHIIIPLFVCLLAVPLVMTKNEIFGMGQDQGVYQIQAINFMYGDYSRQKDLTEYQLLENSDEQEEFLYYVKNYLGGYDIPDEDFPDSVYDRNVSPVSGIIHGIPTYSAILAMWGTLFGMSNMVSVETVFYICMIFMVYFICRNLKLKKISCLAACMASAAAPVMIWVAKSTLTEMFLTLLPALFIYFMTDEENPKHKWLSILPVAVFACYHVSIYTMIPVFIMIYAGMYFFTRERQYAVLLPVTIAGYLASYFMMCQVQPFYTMNNYRSVYVGGINVHNITLAVTAVCIMLLAASGIYIFILARKKKSFNAQLFAKKASENKAFKIFLSLLIILPILYIAAKAFTKYESLEDASYLTLWGFICNAGILLVPAAIIVCVAKPGFYAADKSKLVVFLMFFYCILIYSAFLRYDIQYYYYYSRYLAPFIPIAAIFAVMTLDRIGGKLIIPLTALGIAFVVPNDSFLMTDKDDTRMQWHVLEDVAYIAQEGDCIVIDKEYMKTLWLPLRAMTDADIYPVLECSENQLYNLDKKYNRVLCITSQEKDSEDYSVLYRNTVNCSEDDLNYTGDIIPMSEEFYESDTEIYVYSFEKYDFNYTAEDDYDRFSGVSLLEDDFFWLDEDFAQLSCGLYPDDYEVTINTGCMVPLDGLETDSLEITFYMNGHLVGEAELNKENNGGDITFDIDEEYIRDGENTLTIHCECWDISEINPGDQRTVSIPVKAIVFTEKE